MPKQWINREALTSLKARIVVSALCLILVLIPLIGLTLNDAFTQQVKNAAEKELAAYVYSVLALTEVENNQLVMPEQLLENQFNVIQSGLYALIYSPDSTGIPLQDVSENSDNTAYQMAWHSNSFLGLKAPVNLAHPAMGDGQFSEVELDGKPHLIYSFSASFEQRPRQASKAINIAQKFPITLHIIKDQSAFQKQIQQFTKQLWLWLLILMVLLVVVQLSWLLWTLNPLAKFTQELNDVEQGRAEKLNETYPTELQAVAKQLNALLDTEQSQRKRYRNALSDLAHSLKTPLAVIQSQHELSQSSIDQLAIINNIIGHQLKRAKSAAGASWHLGVRVSLVADKLVRVLPKIYRDPVITINQQVDKQAVFKGDQEDLSEILGNLLDNACKAAKSQVLLTASVNENGLVITVEDDGHGISEEQQRRIFERGIRADSYQQGDGIGLAIVADLIDSYNGQLLVSRSAKLGGAKFKFSFGFTINRKC